MNYSATQIQAMVREMDHSKKRWRHLKKKNNEEQLGHLKAENTKLEADFPSVFYKHADDELDSTFFEMLQLKRRIERGEMTNEQASALMGQQLFGRYVKPVVDANTPAPPKPMSQEEFYKQSM